MITSATPESGTTVADELQYKYLGALAELGSIYGNIQQNRTEQELARIQARSTVTAAPATVAAVAGKTIPVNMLALGVGLVSLSIGAVLLLRKPGK